VDLLLAVAACCGDDPLQDGQPGTHQPVSAQLVDSAARQRQRPVMAKGAVGQPRSPALDGRL
jgi:hypothetical protein